MHINNTIDKISKKNYYLRIQMKTQSMKNKQTKTHPDIDQKLPSPKMNSGFMTAHHKYSENFIDDLEDFCQYRS